MQENCEKSSRNPSIFAQLIYFFFGCIQTEIMESKEREMLVSLSLFKCLSWNDVRIRGTVTDVEFMSQAGSQGCGSGGDFDSDPDPTFFKRTFWLRLRLQILFLILHERERELRGKLALHTFV
jgi:hypothetical protein